MDNCLLSTKVHELENGFERLLGEYQQLVARQVSQGARIDRLYFMQTGSKGAEKRFCKACGMVIVGDEEHECRVKT